jgi:hypothetical protein
VPQYVTTVTATTNPTANTEDTFIEISLPAGNAGIIKRCHLSMQTPNSDARITANLRRVSAAGAGGTAGTANKKNSIMRNTGATATVKNGATAMTVGTAVDLPQQININGRASYDWIPRNYMEEIVVQGGQRFALGLLCSAVSQVVTVTVEWED